MEMNSVFEKGSMCIEEIFDNMKFELGNKDWRYKSMIKNIESTKEEYINLKKVLENDKPESLNMEECAELIKILELQRQMHKIEENVAFLSGFKECFLIFRDCGII